MLRVNGKKAGEFDMHPDAMPDGADRAARIDALKASFHAINAEDKPVTAAIARNARALAAAPGRLSPKERTIWEFQRYLATALTGPLDDA